MFSPFPQGTHTWYRIRASRRFVLRTSLVLLLLALPTTAQNDKTTVALELGKPVERELAGGQSHRYTIRMTSGQYLHVVVDQRGIDVALRLFRPDGNQVVEVDSPNGTVGLEPLFAIADVTGSYSLEVRSLDKTAPVGRYEAKIAELRISTALDESRVAAERIFIEAELLRVQGTPESNQNAIKKYEEAIPLFRSAHEDDREAETLNNCGVAYQAIGQKQKALDYYERSLKIFRDNGNRGSQAAALKNIGSVYEVFGEMLKAIAFYEQSVPLFRAAGDQDGEAKALTSMAVVYNTIGEKQKALECLQQAIPIRESGDRNGLATTLNNIGGVYDDLGEKRKALDYYGKAQTIYHALGDRDGEALTLNNIGGAYQDLGEKSKALGYYNRALLLYTEGDLDDRAMTLNNIGAVYHELKDQRKALDYYAQALPLYHSVGNLGREARALGNIGAAHDALGEKQEALIAYKQALLLSHEVNDRTAEARTLDRLMSFYKVDNARLATFYGKQSVNVYQQLRSQINGLDVGAQKAYLKSIEDTYRHLAGLLLTQNRFAEAQQVLNSFKDEQFFDFGQSPLRPLSPLRTTARENELRSRYEEIIDRASTINAQLAELKRKIDAQIASDEEKRNRPQLESTLKGVLDEFSTLLAHAESDFLKAKDEMDRTPEIPDMIEIQTVLRQINNETGQKAVAIYTLVDETDFQLLIISPDDVFSNSKKINGAELNDKARELWDLYKSADYDPSRLSSELYNIIFQPIEGKLPKDTKTIIWSLDGNLRYLPMAALYDGKRYLIERFNHVVFTRVDKERLTRSVDADWTGYGFSSSSSQKVTVEGTTIDFAPLDFARDEMQIFRIKTYPKGIIDGEVLSEEHFTKASLLNSLKLTRPLVHISSHFRFRPGDEAHSFLVLGDGGFMTLSEIRAQPNLFRGVQLLALSACDTAAQRPDATGREVDGFAELTQRLGAGAVLASLWSVRDSSTAQLMKVFYRNRQGGRFTKAEALRQAQLDLLYGKSSPALRTTSREATTTREEPSEEEVVVEPKYLIHFSVDSERPFAHPYYWAPFVLFGNWK